jgi:outer membrane biosynthesis protein TonB
MKPLRLNAAAVVLVLLLGISLGCQHKKPVLVMPQQPPATTAPQATPTPEPVAQAADQPLAPTPTPTPAEQPKPEEKTKPNHVRHAAAKKPPKTVVQAEKIEPPTISLGQISPGPTPADAAHSQASTDQLLQSAETNLNSITRQLSKDEEAMRAQIKEFINQSRKATTENDPARAHNFAVKARLLSDDLVKQR